MGRAWLAPAGGGDPGLEKPARILVIRFSSIGDILLTTPLLRVLSHAFPGAEVDYLTKAGFAPLLRSNPRIQRLWELSPPYGASELRALAIALRRREYDLILDLHKSLRTRWLRLHLPGRWESYRKGVLRRTLYVHLKLRGLAPARPVRERYFDSLRAFGLRDDGGPLEYYLVEEEQAWAAEELRRTGLATAEPRVGLAIGAGKATKRWPAEHFAQLGHWLRKRLGAAFLILGDERDRVHAGLLQRELEPAAASFAGRTDLRQTAALLAHCHVVVSNDSGLMHLADALGKKLVAIFGGTTPELGFAPRGENAVIVERKGMPCRPCSHIGRDRCPRGHFLCMKGVHPIEVGEAVLSSLP